MNNYKQAIVAHPAMGIVAQGEIKTARFDGDSVHIEFRDPNMGKVCAHRQNVVLSERELRA